MLVFRPVDGDHCSVLAPLQWSDALSPVQIVISGLVVNTGSGVTSTVTEFVLLHPNCVPVTVYTVVNKGDAITEAVFETFNQAASDH